MTARFLGIEAYDLSLLNAFSEEALEMTKTPNRGWDP